MEQRDDAPPKNENTTIKLWSPVEIPGHTVDELTMRELSVDENIALGKAHGNKTTLEQDKEFFALMTGQPPEVIGKLKNRDWMRLKNKYWETLGNVEPASNTSE